jgi:hypothetical protein
MRELADAARIRAFMKALADRATSECRVYFTGGASAVLEGWRQAELPGWEDRSPFIERIGRVSFHHYDFLAQALAKVERGETKDLADVRAMIARGLATPAGLWDRFRRIEPEIYRFPAISPAAFRRALEAAVGPES